MKLLAPFDSFRRRRQAGARKSPPWKKPAQDWIHLDVWNGHFVPNITMGPALIAALRKTTGLPFDVHLMYSNPDRYSTPSPPRAPTTSPSTWRRPIICIARWR